MSVYTRNINEIFNVVDYDRQIGGTHYINIKEFLARYDNSGRGGRAFTPPWLQFIGAMRPGSRAFANWWRRLSDHSGNAARANSTAALAWMRFIGNMTDRCESFLYLIDIDRQIGGTHYMNITEVFSAFEDDDEGPWGDRICQAVFSMTPNSRPQFGETFRWEDDDSYNGENIRQFIGTRKFNEFNSFIINDAYYGNCHAGTFSMTPWSRPGFGELINVFSPQNDTTSSMYVYAKNFVETIEIYDAFTKSGAFNYNLNFAEILGLLEPPWQIIYILTEREVAEIYDAVSATYTAGAGNSVTVKEMMLWLDAFSKTTVYPRAINELFQEIDVFTRTAIFPRSLSETFQLYDSFNKQATLTRTLNDTLQGIDKLTRTTIFPRSLNETLQTHDSFTRTAIFPRSLNETIQLYDVLSKTSSLTRSLNETLQFLDALTRKATFPRSLNETFQIYDSFAKASVLTKRFNHKLQFVDASGSEWRAEEDSVWLRAIWLRTPNETMQVFDRLSSTNLFLRQLNEALEIFDYVSAGTGGARTYTAALNELIQLIDSFNKTGLYARSFSEVAQIWDSPARTGIFPRQIFETLQLYDAFSKTSALTRLLNEPIQLYDALQKTSVLTRPLSETLQFYDVFTSQNIFLRQFGEQMQLYDYLDKTAALTRTITEISQIYDSFGKTSIINELINETIQIFDKLNSTNIFLRGIPEALQFYDSLNKTSILTRTLNEPLEIFDYATTAFSHFMVITPYEILNIYDALNVAGGRHYYELFLKEAFTFTDSLTSTWFEGCLDYDYLVATFNSLTSLATGKSIAKTLERIDP